MENGSSLSIKMWAEEDRPREKLLLKGKQALSDAELVAILIASGNENETAVELSKKILASVSNNLNELGKLDVEALKKFKGIGEAKALSIIAALELGRRRQASDALEKPVVNTPEKAYNLLLPYLADLPHESFVVLHLNPKQQCNAIQVLSSGGISGTVVDVRLLLKAAIEKLSSAIIIAHNHPSGNPLPSHPDIQITNQIRQLCTLLGIELNDHIIVGNNTFYSFKDNGKL